MLRFGRRFGNAAARSQRCLANAPLGCNTEYSAWHPTVVFPRSFAHYFWHDLLRLHCTFGASFYQNAAAFWDLILDAQSRPRKCAANASKLAHFEAESRPIESAMEWNRVVRFDAGQKRAGPRRKISIWKMVVTKPSCNRE